MHCTAAWYADAPRRCAQQPGPGWVDTLPDAPGVPDWPAILSACKRLGQACATPLPFMCSKLSSAPGLHHWPGVVLHHATPPSATRNGPRGCNERATPTPERGRSPERRADRAVGLDIAVVRAYFRAHLTTDGTAFSSAASPSLSRLGRRPGGFRLLHNKDPFCHLSVFPLSV